VRGRTTHVTIYGPNLVDPASVMTLSLQPALDGAGLSHPTSVTGAGALELSVLLTEADGPAVFQLDYPSYYWNDSPPGEQDCHAVVRSQPLTVIPSNPRVIARPKVVGWPDYYGMLVAGDEAADFAVLAPHRCSDAAVVLTIGPLRLASGPRCVFKSRFADARGGWSASVSPARIIVSLRGKRAVRRVVHWVLTDAGAPVEAGRLAFRRYFRPGRPDRQVFADRNIDEYINYCIDESQRIYSEGGGHLYCWRDGYQSRWLTSVEPL